MSAQPEFDLVVYGASGFTGRLVAEYPAQQYGVGGDTKWAVVAILVVLGPTYAVLWMRG